MANADVVAYLKKLRKSFDDPIRQRGIDRAVASVEKYPLRLTTEQSARDLAGIGDWIGKKIGGFLRGKENQAEAAVDIGAVEVVLSQHCSESMTEVVADEEEAKKWRVVELKQKCKENGLVTSGNKAELLQRYLTFKKLGTSGAPAVDIATQSEKPKRKRSESGQFPVSLLSKNGTYPSIRYASASYALMLAFHRLASQGTQIIRIPALVMEAQKHTLTKLGTAGNQNEPQQWYSTGLHSLRATLLKNNLIETAADGYRLTELGKEFGVHLWACHSLEIRHTPKKRKSEDKEAKQKSELELAREREKENERELEKERERRRELEMELEREKELRREREKEKGRTTEEKILQEEHKDSGEGLITPKVEIIVIDTDGEESRCATPQTPSSPHMLHPLQTPPSKPLLPDAADELQEILQWGRELGVRSPPPKIPKKSPRSKVKKISTGRSLSTGRRIVNVGGQQALTARSVTPQPHPRVLERVDWRSFASGASPVKRRKKLIVSKSNYKVMCVVDHRERQWGTLLVNRLTAKGIPCLSRSLEIGDFIWIAVAPDGTETVLDTIVERKRVADLAGSIMDGRYNDQKQRMIHTGLRNLIYVVEGNLNDRKNMQTALETALLTTSMFDGLFVEHTTGTDGTIAFLQGIHHKLDELVANCADIEELKVWGVKKKAPPPFGEAVNLTNQLPSFSEFTNREKTRNADAANRNMFATQLSCVKGLSYQGACSVTAVYPSATALYKKYTEFKSQNRTAMAELCLSTVPTRTKTRFVGDHVSSLVYKAFMSESG